MRHLYTLLSLLFVPFFINADPAYYLETVSSVVPLHIRSKLILVEGVANKKNGFFLFDTGASELILNEAKFPRRSPSGPESFFVDVNGRRMQYSGHAYVSSFDWGGLRREGFLAPRLNMQGLESLLGEQLLGIIGFDVLQHVDLELDYYGRAMTLLRPGYWPSRPDKSAGPDYTFEFTMDRHLPVVAAKLGDAAGLLLAIDSGSSINVCARRLKRKLRGKALQKRTVSLQGAAGITERPACYVMESLQVEGAYSIAYCRVALGDLRALKDYGLQVDGFLGVNFFRLGRVFFSYHSRTISVWLGSNDYTLRHSALKPVSGLSAE